MAWANGQFQSIKSGRAYTERQWYLNLAFYYGRQNVVFRQNPNLAFGGNGALYVPPAPYWRVRAIFNYVKPTIRREIAKLNSNKPTVNVMPASVEDRDIFAAQAAEEIWDSTYRRKQVRRTIRRATFWSQTCGTSFIKAYWNPLGRDEDSVTDSNEGPTGDFDLQAVTPFHVYVPDLREEELENQPYLIHAQMRDLDYVKMFFNNKTTIGASGTQGEQILDDSWINLIGARPMQNAQQVLCLEVWIKPGVNTLFPNGGMFTVVGDQLMPNGTMGWPYEHGMYPFAKLEHIPSGKFYADSTINDLISPQREFNRTRSQIIEAKNRMAKPQLLAERGSIDARKITTEPGQVIEYETGYQPPQPLPLQSLPNYVVQEPENLKADMNEISGQHETSRGQAPSGVTAATAISYLQEQDDSMLSHTFDSLEEGIEKVAKMILSYANQFWTEERGIKVVGPSGSFDFKTFKASDLRGNTDIRVEAGSALPSSKAATQAFIMDLMDRGHIDPAKGLDLMQISNLNKLYETVRLDERQASRENLRLAAITEEDMMAKEQQDATDFQQNPDDFFEPSDPNAPNRIPVDPPPLVPVNTWDNHPVHIEVHNNYRKSQAFENLPEHTKALFELHVNQHLGAIMATQAPVSMPEEEEQAGTPGPKPLPENQGL